MNFRREHAVAPHALKLSIMNRIVVTTSSEEVLSGEGGKALLVRSPRRSGKFREKNPSCYAGLVVEKKSNLITGAGISASSSEVPSQSVIAEPGEGKLHPDQPGQTGSAQQRIRRTDARRGVSEKITVCALEGASAGSVITTGWALNMSRSGVRAILEERVLAGVDYEVTIGEVGTSQLTRRARVVWVQEEHDGVVVGLEFLVAMSTTAPPTQPSHEPPDTDPHAGPDSASDPGRRTDPDPTPSTLSDPAKTGVDKDP